MLWTFTRRDTSERLERTCDERGQLRLLGTAVNSLPLIVDFSGPEGRFVILKVAIGELVSEDSHIPWKRSPWEPRFNLPASLLRCTNTGAPKLFPLVKQHL